MAREKRRKKVSVDPNIVDYYVLYNIVRGTDGKEIVSQLRKKQGEIKQMMSAGSLNGEEIMEKLMAQDKLITAAIKIFKSPERIEEYNAQLDAAYESGTLNTVAQEEYMSALEEIEKLFLSGKYNAVIRKCIENLDAKGANAKLYEWLAKSYYMTDQGDLALETIDEFAAEFPMEPDALDLGVRFSILLGSDIGKAQNYLNAILANFEGSAFAFVDQIYLHLAEKNLDMAYQEIDEYLNVYPTDEEFRKTVAYDIIGFCSRLYTTVNYEGTDIAFLTSAQDYELCHSMTEKAYSLFNDATTKEYAEYTNEMGKTEFNSDNWSNIRWTFLATWIYLCPSIITIGAGISEGDLGLALPGLLLILLGVACGFCSIGLLKVSKRPYWQIYKYELTGEREPKEQLYITIGNIIAGYMRWSFKAALKIIELIFYFV